MFYMMLCRLAEFIMIAAIFAGFGYGATNVIPWAMVADVVEVDELKSGKRREGIYSGYLVFFRKMAAAITIFLVTRVLAMTGFITIGPVLLKPKASKIRLQWIKELLIYGEEPLLPTTATCIGASMNPAELLS